MPGKHENIVVVPPKGAPIKSPQPGVWKTTGRVSLFHDAKTKNLRVAIKQLKEEDFGEYECKSDDKSDSSDDGDQDVEVDGKKCCIFSYYCLSCPLLKRCYRVTTPSKSAPTLPRSIYEMQQHSELNDLINWIH